MATAPKIIGRGGAGNFRDPTTTTTSDRSAAASTPTTPDTRTVNPNPPSIRSGRGGAGNINPSASTSTSSTTASAAGASQAARREGLISEAPESTGTEVIYGGRGGAGNWKVGREGEEERRRAEEEGRRREVEERVRREVEGVGGVRVPGRVYRGVGRGEEGEEEG